MRRGKYTILIAMVLEQRIAAHLGKQNAGSAAFKNGAMIAAQRVFRGIEVLDAKPSPQGS
jgi:hypothetical protein